MKTLVFVYNATSGLLDKFIDSAHKIVSPDTYDCSLCKLTHGNFKEKQIWTDFRNQAQVPLKFMYKNEFEKQYRSKWLPKYEYPIVFLAEGYQMEPVINAQDFQELESLEMLINKVKAVIIEVTD